MCGIAGIIRSDGPADAEVVGRMADRLGHRGPDQRGSWAEGGAALAARRLAVIDPAGSPQPISNEDGTVRLVSNGEIYNFRDLRRDLESRGHAFRTGGDAEVLVHLYEDHGEDLFGRLVGMFALAIWDSGRRRLVLARDRLGQKPLYWWHGPAGIAFASEIEALLECPDVPRRADRRALGEFLRFGCVPAPATGFEGIQKLPPAHYLVFDAAAGRVSGPTRYWDIPRGPVRRGVTRQEWCERLREALGEAVRMRLVADVPLGVLLSGGLDSSVVVALAAEHSPGPVRTFTVRFGESGWDESLFARQVAARFSTDHTEVQVEPVAAATIEAAEVLVRRHGEPFADSSSIAMYFLAGEARRQVTVALSGDGGDESFGGYPRHAALAVSEQLGLGARTVLAGLGRWMPPGAERKGRWNALRRFLRPLDREPLERYLAWRSLFQAEDLASAGPRPLLAPEFAADALAADPLERWGGLLRGMVTRPVLDRAMAIDLLDYLPNDCLAKVDIASMARGLEVRSPMLDHRVVELARRMPVALKWRERLLRPPLGKAILREAFADRLPREVLRRGKMGFGVPVGRWLAGECADWMRGILLDGRTLGRGLFNRGGVEAMVDAHTARRADHGDRLWALVCLELWFRTFLD